MKCTILGTQSESFSYQSYQTKTVVWLIRGGVEVGELIIKSIPDVASILSLMSPSSNIPPSHTFYLAKFDPFWSETVVLKKVPNFGDMCRYLHKSELGERGIKPSPKTPEAFLQKAFIKKSFWAIIPKNYWWWGVPDKTYVQLNWTSSKAGWKQPCLAPHHHHQQSAY